MNWKLSDALQAFVLDLRAEQKLLREDAAPNERIPLVPPSYEMRWERRVDALELRLRMEGVLK